jgi:branched-chain amino acid transport system ATP-binding protein
MLLRLQNINHSFSSAKIILKNVSIELHKGKIYVLMGVNGSGKTTLFNIISGFLRPKSGQMFVPTRSIPVPFGYGLGLGFMARTFQDLRVVTKLTVKQNIELAIRDHPTQLWYKALVPRFVYSNASSAVEEKAVRVISRCFLERVKYSLAGEISYGEQKLVNLACCIANDASLLLLDEPVASINQEYVNRTVDLLKTLRAEGKTILLIEHNTDFARAVADNFLFLNNGQLTSYGTMAQLVNDNDVLQAYI